MNDDTRSILDLLAQGKISVDEAHQLIDAVNRLGASQRQLPETSS